MPRKSRTERDPEKKAFMKQLLDYYQPKTVADMQEMLKDLLKDALQDSLEAELEEELGYERYDNENKQTDNSRQTTAGTDIAARRYAPAWERSSLRCPETGKASSNLR